MNFVSNQKITGEQPGCPPAYFNTFSSLFKEDYGSVISIRYELLDSVGPKYRYESFDLIRILVSFVYAYDINVCLGCHGIA